MCNFRERQIDDIFFPKKLGFDISLKLSPTEIICMKCLLSIRVKCQIFFFFCVWGGGGGGAGEWLGGEVGWG